jgi:transcription-repair coupling factor (superfamily II helicase)
VAAFLRSNVPELKFAIAHGQMGAGELDDIMNAFYDGQYDVLLSTTIVESGLDVPTANTLIVHRADMFGLAQLYQLRGRVGRSKVRAYALFTLPVNKMLTATADKRLKVLQSLDTLGAGFQLASHDLDIRGAATCSARSSPATSRKSASSSTSTCWKRPLPRCAARTRCRHRLVAADHGRHAGDDPGRLCAGSASRLGLYRRLGEITDIAILTGSVPR